MRNSNLEPRNQRIKLRRIMNWSPFAINKNKLKKLKGKVLKEKMRRTQKE